MKYSLSLITALLAVLLYSFASAVRVNSPDLINPDEAVDDAVQSTPGSIGSLPPPLLKSTPTSLVPAELLPSALNVITHHAQPAQDVAALRPDCKGVVNNIIQSASSKNQNSAAFIAYMTIVEILSKEKPNEDHYNNDKNLNYAIDNLARSSSGGASLDWHYQVSLRNCAVDNEGKGRTVLMELVRRGYIQSVSNIHSRKLCTVDYDKLNDTENNNLIHLAAMSSNASIVNIVLSLFSPQLLVRLMEAHNMYGMRPLDISNSLMLEDVSDKLKASYSVAQTAVEFRERLRAQKVAVAA